MKEKQKNRMKVKESQKVRKSEDRKRKARKTEKRKTEMKKDRERKKGRQKKKKNERPKMGLSGLSLLSFRWTTEVVPSDAAISVQASLKHHLRFPSMPIDFLATKVDPTGVLTKEELLSVAFDATCSPCIPKRSGFPSRFGKDFG